MVPIKDLKGNMLSLEELKEAIKFVKAQRQPEEPFEVVVAGRTQDPFDIEKVNLCAKVGATWWLETIDQISFGWQFGGELPIEAMETRVREGPPMV
ncbi:MAG: hypothetical protein MUO26_07830 [Methanotrichaceae archaeon]|nr:hypothetical protein [Methanotrichaceae archaeon]